LETFTATFMGTYVVLVSRYYQTGSSMFFPVCPDGERQTDGTDASRKRDARSSAGHHKSEDTSDSREDEAAVSLFLATFCFVPSSCNYQRDFLA
ncbi:hypothetical protein XENOCAPTIV_009963, partial [Xenoophorus captivus]